MATTKLLTAEEFGELPDDGAAQAYRGEVRTSPPPGSIHGEIAAQAIMIIGPYIRAHELGRIYDNIGFRISRDPDTIRAPDVAFVVAGRMPRDASPAGYPDFAPDFLIEVVSPWDRAADVQEKMIEWMAAGVRLAWVLYPKQRNVAVYLPGGQVHLVALDGTLDGGDVLPGFTCPVRDLFPD